jgi:hypothetical protein
LLGILARDNDSDQKDLDALGIEKVDFVVCNLYPFKETVAKPYVNIEEAVEEIDIGTSLPCTWALYQAVLLFYERRPKIIPVLLLFATLKTILYFLKNFARMISAKKQEICLHSKSNLCQNLADDRRFFKLLTTILPFPTSSERNILRGINNLHYDMV